MLDERKQKILKAVVNTYVRTAEPVASDRLSALSDLGVRAATIRNEMAEMSEMGYLKQPHTSAGRVPSDLGYRFFVDRLMPHDPVRTVLGEDAGNFHGRLGSAVDDVLTGTCRFLCAITHLTALATGPTSGTIRLVWIEIRKVAQDKIVVLTMWSNGQLRHALAGTQPLTESTLNTVRKVVSDVLVGQASSELRHQPADELPSIPRPALPLVKQVKDLIADTAREVTRPDVYVDGTSCFARQPEFQERQAIEHVLSVLEEHDTLAQLLEAAAVGRHTQVIIGEENPLEPLRSCSLVAASYSSESGMRGSIGVCGSTRMDYRRTVAAVEFVAQSLSDILAQVLPA